MYLKVRAFFELMNFLSFLNMMNISIAVYEGLFCSVIKKGLKTSLGCGFTVAFRNEGQIIKETRLNIIQSKISRSVNEWKFLGLLSNSLEPLGTLRNPN